jgi:hypothetical protein
VISSLIGITYPGLYAVVTQATVTVSDPGPWYVDTFRCVTFTVVGLPWNTLPASSTSPPPEPGPE